MMDNYTRMKMRAIYAQNDRQHNRMVKDKQKSLHRALLYSYQTSWIRKDGTDYYVRALINPDKVKFDYDEKIVSVDFQHEFKCGDVFEWKGTYTYWIILKQELTEVAYFRGNVRRCQALEVTDPDTKEKRVVWGAIRGPVETKIDSLQKHNLAVELLSASINMYVPGTEENIKLFKRGFKFKFKGRVWEIQHPDDISTPGILEFTAVEDYECDYDVPLVEQVDPNPPKSEEAIQISGETFIKPILEYMYNVNTEEQYSWTVTPIGENKDISDVVKINVSVEGALVSWTSMLSGSFVLNYGPYSKTIVVESLF